MLFRIAAFAFMALAFAQDAPAPDAEAIPPPPVEEEAIPPPPVVEVPPPAPTFEPGTCTTIEEALATDEDFAVFAGLLETSGLDLDGFKGTIFVPSEGALNALVESLGNLTLIDDLDELLASVISYHAVPDVLLYSDFLDTLEGSVFETIPLPTLANDGDVDDVCTFLGLPVGAPTITLATTDGIEIVEGLGEDGDVEDADLEFCGPIVVHVIDAVLIPCGVAPTPAVPGAAAAPAK